MISNMKSHSFLAATALLLAHAPAHAALNDPLVDGAKLCAQQFKQQEQAKGIPPQVLAAIANTESGRWSKALGMVVPWPWTINAEGQGFYFDSKAEAIRKVRSLQAQGVKSIDVGCMQISMKHHPNAFANLDQAFEPRYNVGYAAKFLRSNYDDIGNWSGAIGAYHSRTPMYGNKYKARVQKALDAISGKVRTAYASVDSVARRDSPSYRIIRIGEDEAPAERKSVRTVRPQTANSMQLAMRESEGTSGSVAPLRAPSKKGSNKAAGIALRPQDRLSSTSNVSVLRPAASYKHISVRSGDVTRGGDENAASATTIVRRLAGAAKATPLAPTKADAKAQAGANAKFIFID